MFVIQILLKTKSVKSAWSTCSQSVQPTLKENNQDVKTYTH